eukprot:gene7091-7892_t
MSGGYFAKHHKTNLVKNKARPSSPRTDLSRHFKTSSFLSQARIGTALTKHKRPENSSSHLRSALDVLAPPEADVRSNSQEYRLPLLSKPVPERFHSEAPRSSSDLSNNNTKNDVVFEVIDIDPYVGNRSRFNRRFFILTGIYAVSGLVSVIAACCIAKVIMKRRRRHSQYMLLTKSDMEYHRGGGLGQVWQNYPTLVPFRLWSIKLLLMIV